MKSTFTVKYLQHLNKKNGNKGFTLIELLVVIIIVGVLAAIALPSFLNQIGKARGSEAKSNLGTINRAQQSYRLENQTFATTLANLDAKITGTFYSYTPAAGQFTARTTTTTTNADLKLYAAGVAQSGDNSSASILCESNNTQGQGGDVSVTMTGSGAGPSSGTCAGNSKAIN